MKNVIPILIKHIYQSLTFLSTWVCNNFRKCITLFSLIVGIYGAIISVSDDISYFRNKRNQSTPWSSINEAIKNLNEFDVPIPGGKKVSALYKNENGYPELFKIISDNVSDTIMDNVTGIFAQKRGMRQKIAGTFEVTTIYFGVIRGKTINGFIENFDVLNNWISNYRKQFYLIRGLRIILLSFVLQFISVLLPKRLTFTQNKKRKKSMKDKED